MSEVASGFAGKAKAASNEKRIQKFLKNFPFDAESVALFVASKLPEGQWILTTDLNMLGVRMTCSLIFVQ